MWQVAQAQAPPQSASIPLTEFLMATSIKVMPSLPSQTVSEPSEPTNVTLAIIISQIFPRLYGNLA
jgi:hypothetical protein